MLQLESKGELQAWLALGAEMMSSGPSGPSLSLHLFSLLFLFVFLYTRKAETTDCPKSCLYGQLPSSMADHSLWTEGRSSGAEEAVSWDGSAH